MDKTVDKEIRGLLKRMQNNRQRWRQETNKKTNDEIARLLKRMQFKRRLLAETPSATPEDWEALAAEYEAEGFKYNAINCRARANKMKEGLHGKEVPQLREAAQDDRLLQEEG